MPAAPSGAREGLVLATGVLALAAVFSWKQWVERRTRDHETMSDADVSYFSGKDRRRFTGTAVLALIGVGMLVGSLIDYRANKAAGQWFVWIWIGVGLLVCLSLILAILDWMANRTYALRHLRALAEERKALLEEEKRLRAAPRNGHGGENGTVRG